jgi:arginyl-tRNA synthetase
MLSQEGDTGPLLQYTYSRLCTLEQRMAPHITLRAATNQIDLSLLRESIVRDIVFHLAAYPNVVSQAQRTHEPSGVLAYSFKLSHLLHSAKGKLVVKDQEEEITQARLLLFRCARLVWESAMRLLTLTPLERM